MFSLKLVNGGAVSGARNVISANTRDGVLLINPGVAGNLIQGNFIGTDITGNVALGNQGFGVPATSFLDGQQQKWAPLGLPYGMSTANVPDLSGGNASGHSPPLTLRRSEVGRTRPSQPICSM